MVRKMLWEQNIRYTYLKREERHVNVNLPFFVYIFAIFIKK